MDDIFVDQLISDGRAIKICGGQLTTDDHYVVEIMDSQGDVISRATGYELEKVFIEAFQATPPRTQPNKTRDNESGETLRESILTGIAAQLLAELKEAQGEIERLKGVSEDAG